MDGITVKKVVSKKELKQFMMLPWKVYEKDPAWVAPLISGYKKVFDKNKNPFFLHGEMELFLAEKNGEVVGRIAAVINHLHNSTWNDKTGFFGFYESFDDQQVANVLLDTAKKWLQERGFDIMRGPASPTSNEDYGVMFDGFEHRQVILSTHNTPYYLKLYEQYGLKAIKELYAFRFTKEVLNSKSGEKAQRLKEAIHQRTGVVLEDLDMKKFAEGVKTFKGIFNAAWTTDHNHGWVPLTDEEFDFITGDLKAITDPQFVMFAKVNGKVIGGCICLPDYNEIFQPWKGKLFPFNWVDMFTKAKKLKGLRIVILGVVPEFQRSGIDALMYIEIVQRAVKRGIEWAEASYIVEDNEPMKKPLINIGGEVYKKYKVMEMPI